jgi:hypothetical protein
MRKCLRNRHVARTWRVWLKFSTECLLEEVFFNAASALGLRSYFYSAMLKTWLPSLNFQKMIW